MVKMGDVGADGDDRRREMVVKMGLIGKGQEDGYGRVRVRKSVATLKNRRQKVPKNGR